jgi:hypothetical protein
MCIGCLFAFLAISFPRVGFLILWILTPWVEVAFDDNWFGPLAAVILAPYTGLIYVLVDVSTVGDINTGGWILIAFAVVADVMHWGQMISNRRNAQDMYTQYRPGVTD